MNKPTLVALAALAVVGVLVVRAVVSGSGVEGGGEMRPDRPDPDLGAWMDKTYGEGTGLVLTELKWSKKLYIPAVGMKEAMLKEAVTPDTAGSARAPTGRDVHMVRMPLPTGGTVGQAAAYTELRWVKAEMDFVREVEARPWLEGVLRSPDSEGLAINPKTRFLSEAYDGVQMSMNRFALAELIGYLDSEADTAGRSADDLANEAYREGRYYEVLYYWGLAFRRERPGDDWKRAQASKLRAYQALDFPGSRERVVGELAWTRRTHPAPEFEALAAELGQ